MPKLIHQQTVDFFHDRPAAAVELLRAVGGINPPQFAMATAEAVDATQLNYVFGRIPAVAGERLKELLMTASADYEKVIGDRYFSEWVNKGLEQGLEQGRQEGRAEGEIEAILAVLDARGLDIPSEARERISRCSDLHLLEKWIRRAATAKSVDDLFS
ncbi:hypothetical protein [Microbispora sp. H10836]|uniref:hypothetical protein n=1 Tax=Microbispora sp. H10836 TaxID=2729106 RepID=UPI002016320D|nr:hypothetical protein [Microbispora sp. H10836]